MAYLDTGRLAAIAADAATFLDRKPYPWAGLQDVIVRDGFRQLAAELPSADLFAAEFGKVRGYGQQSHDRYALQYRPRLDERLAPSWREFIGELSAQPYQEFVRRTFGLGDNERFVLSMHWHHAPAGASVSPHADARRKVGSHIFYFNTEDDWDPAWGGQTVVLDDDGKLSPHASPPVDSLREVARSQILGNMSFIFKRTEHSWHAVRPIACPPDRLRKVFIVVINRVNLQVLWRRLRGKDPDGVPL
jgi:hypothetical protein